MFPLAVARRSAFVSVDAIAKQIMDVVSANKCNGSERWLYWKCSIMYFLARSQLNSSVRTLADEKEMYDKFRLIRRSIWMVERYSIATRCGNINWLRSHFSSENCGTKVNKTEFRRIKLYNALHFNLNKMCGTFGFWTSESVELVQFSAPKANSRG